MPIVSIVIPTFGRPGVLRRAVDSVLTQSLLDIQLVVVVDGKDEETVSYITSIVDSRVLLIVNDEKKGAGLTRDIGARASSGDWVAFLDDDDEWLPSKLAAQVELARPDEKVILMTLTEVVTSNGRFIKPSEPYDNAKPIDEWLFDRWTWLKEGQGFLQTSSIMFPRALINTIGFKDTKQHEEWELVIRAVKQYGYRLQTVDEALVIYYAPNSKPSLSQTYTWQRSIDWIDGLGNLITPRAYSGFCLNNVNKMVIGPNRARAMLQLFKIAIAKGRPTLKQLFAFGFVWILPSGTRKRLRSALSSQG